MFSRPRFYVDRIVALDPAYLAQNYRAILLDVDNTLVPHGGMAPDSETRRWLKALAYRDLRVALATNTSSRRAGKLEHDWGIEAFRALKPLPFRIRRWLIANDLTPADTLLVGDQILTDYLAAVGSGLDFALVAPLSNHDALFTAVISRRIERLALDRWGISPKTTES